ncbi:MAG: YraN family protein [Clostridia bacterium]|nr:YraN family protein [Clostridia bacterium]
MRGKNASGALGEECAAKHLESLGYRILCRNYRTHLAEIDIIATHGGCLCFVEVKTRKSKNFGSAYESVNFSKRQKMILGARSFMAANRSFSQFRFDVVEVYGTAAGGGFAVNEINVIQNAFEV